MSYRDRGLRERAARDLVRQLNDWTRSHHLQGQDAEKPSDAPFGAWYRAVDTKRTYWWNGYDWVLILSQAPGEPPTVQHEELPDLLGGDQAGHYHLTEAQHRALTPEGGFGQNKLVYSDAEGLLRSALGLHTDDSGARLGIGVPSPGYPLDVSGDVRFTGDLLFAGVQGVRALTDDGSDTGRFLISGGGYWASNRGATIALAGNEYADGYRGSLLLVAGSPGTTGLYDGLVSVWSRGVEVSRFIGGGAYADIELLTFGLVESQVQSSATSQLAENFRALHRTTEQMADGFGAAVGFYAQDADGVPNLLARVAARRAGADNTGDLLVQLASAGSMANRLLVGNSRSVVYTASGYITLGPENTGWCHIRTDRAAFWFDHSIAVKDGVIQAYNASMALQAPQGTTRLTLDQTTGLATFTNSAKVTERLGVGGDPDSSLPLLVTGAGKLTGALEIGGNLTMTGYTVSGAAYVDIEATAGRGIRFWSSDSYKIHMGSASEYYYGPVTSYAIKFNMSNTAGQGWVFGVAGAAPVAAIEVTTGNLQTKGLLSAEAGLRAKGGSYWTRFAGSASQAADITYTLPAASSDGYLKNAGGVLSWDSAASGGWVLVTSGAWTSGDLNITGLDGNSHFVYLLVLEVTSGGHTRLTFNSDTGTNYRYAMHWVERDGGTNGHSYSVGTAGTYLPVDPLVTPAGNKTIRALIRAGSGHVRQAVIECTGYTDDSNFFQVTTHGVWTNTTANLTSVQVARSTSHTPSGRYWVFRPA